MYFQHDSLEGLISITIAGLEQLGTPGVGWEHVLTLKKSEDNSRHLVKWAGHALREIIGRIIASSESPMATSYY
jgi:hypothetical protein